MKKPEQNTVLRLAVLAIAIAASVFVLDLWLPLGIAVPMMYVAPVVISLWSPQERFTLITATAGTALTGLGFFLSPASEIAWMGILNRLLALLIIWVTALLILRHKQAREDIKTLRGLVPVCASCKKIRDDKGFWNGLEKYVEEHSEVLFTHSLCPACEQKWYPELHPELHERHPEIYKEDA